MRENPWHLRLPTTEHYQWFRNIVAFHELTREWLKELEPNRLSDFYTRGLSPEVTENLWMLKSLPEGNLDILLDDTAPHDLLGRLEHIVWAIQANTLAHLQGAPEADVDSVLEKISWKLGASTAETRWNRLTLAGHQDLRNILLAINDSPFAGYPRGDGFLIRRAITQEIQIELRFCPHQIHFYEAKSVADKLCRLHAHWMRGFSSSLNNKIQIEHVVQTPRCIQRWFFD